MTFSVCCISKRYWALKLCKFLLEALLFSPGSGGREGEGEATAAGRTGGQNIAAKVFRVK
jgi:hypothetical protein